MMKTIKAQNKTLKGWVYITHQIEKKARISKPKKDKR